MKVAASPRVYIGRCPKAVFKSPVTSHSSLLSNFLRIPFSVSSSRAQPSIFLALRSGSHKHCTETTPWCYVFLLLHILRLSVCKEDFSLTLEMTIRMSDVSQSLSLLDTAPYSSILTSTT